MKTAHYSPLATEFVKRNNSYQCRQCDYTSDQLTNIRNHVDAKHGNGENKYICEECNSEYKTLNSMRAHKSRVHMKKKRKQETSLSKNIEKLRKKSDHELKLQEEILQLEMKTIPDIVNRTSDTNKFIVT